MIDSRVAFLVTDGGGSLAFMSRCAKRCFVLEYVN